MQPCLFHHPWGIIQKRIRYSAVGTIFRFLLPMSDIPFFLCFARYWIIVSKGLLIKLLLALLLLCCEIISLVLLLNSTPHVWFVFARSRSFGCFISEYNKVLSWMCLWCFNDYQIFSDCMFVLELFSNELYGMY